MTKYRFDPHNKVFRSMTKMTDANSIVLDGVEYIRKDSIQTIPQADSHEDIICRALAQGGGECRLNGLIRLCAGQMTTEQARQTLYRMRKKNRVFYRTLSESENAMILLNETPHKGGRKTNKIVEAERVEEKRRWIIDTIRTHSPLNHADLHKMFREVGFRGNPQSICIPLMRAGLFRIDGENYVSSQSGNHGVNGSGEYHAEANQ